MITDPIRDRRQRAREALWDGVPARAVPLLPVGAVEDAVQVATQVKITHDVIMAFMQEPGSPDDIAAPLAAAFRAAGIEVIE